MKEITKAQNVIKRRMTKKNKEELLSVDYHIWCKNCEYEAESEHRTQRCPKCKKSLKIIQILLS